MSVYQTNGTFIETISGIFQALREARYMGKGTSLVEASQATSVNPIVMIDESLAGMQKLSELGGVVQNMFAGYYLSAASVLTQVEGVKISQTLGPLNPARSVFESRTLKASDAALDVYANETHKPSPSRALPSLKNNRLVGSFAVEFNDPNKSSLTDDIKEYSPLSVGRMYDVALGTGEEKAVVKVLIRMLPYMLKPAAMVNMFSFKGHSDMSFKERWFNYKIDKIGLMDLLFQRDLIAKHRNMLITDKSGLYKEIVKRKNRNTIQAFLSGKPSLASISSIALISKETSLDIEDKLDGTLSKYNTRHQLMENTGLMILGVVDLNYERATFYLHSKETPIVVGFKDFALGSKNSAKLEEVLALMVGQGSGGGTRGF